MVSLHVPYYDLVSVQEAVRAGAWVLANKRAWHNATNLDWDSKTIEAFVCCLTARDFYKPYPAQGIFDGRETADADGYRMRFDEELLVRTRDRNCCEFWIKVCLLKKGKRNSVAVGTFHLDGQP